MPHVVIIGGGVAGLPAALALEEIAREGERITLVAERSAFRAGSATPWIAARSGTEIDLARSLGRKGVGFSAAGARRLRPERSALELGDGSSLEYDILVIAAGPRPAFDEIAGLGPDAHTHSLCTPDHLAGCATDWERFLADPGALIVGAAQGAACFAPAYQCAFLMHAELCRRGLQREAPITFLTSEPYVGHLGVDGIGESRAQLEAALRARDIAWIADARIERVERATLHLLEGGGRRQALEFRFAMIMPPFRGIAAIAGIEGLADARGFVLVDERLRNPRYRNIYAAGAAVASAARPDAGAHPNAYQIESMVEAAVRNIRDQLDGREPAAGAAWSPVRVADLGAAGVTFFAAPEGAPQPELGAGGWVQLTRCSACEPGDGAKPLLLR